MRLVPRLVLALLSYPFMTQGQTCPLTLASCPRDGCSTKGANHPLLNEKKNAEPNPNGDIRPLTFSDFKALQDYVSGQLKLPMGFGTDLSASQRLRLAKIPLTSGSSGEGAYVQVAGFLAQPTNPKTPNPHLSDPESANCDLPDEENNDYHIGIVEHDGEDEFKGIVVEMVPRGRRQKWTLEALDLVRDGHRRVLVRGQLMFDNVHKIRRNYGENKMGNSPRFSLWEVHPITEFQVCMRPSNNCTPNTAAGWSDLETVQVADLKKFSAEPPAFFAATGPAMETATPSSGQFTVIGRGEGVSPRAALDAAHANASAAALSECEARGGTAKPIAPSHEIETAKSAQGWQVSIRQVYQCEQR